MCVATTIPDVFQKSPYPDNLPPPQQRPDRIIAGSPDRLEVDTAANARQMLHGSSR